MSWRLLLSILPGSATSFFKKQNVEATLAASFKVGFFIRENHNMDGRHSQNFLRSTREEKGYVSWNEVALYVKVTFAISHPLPEESSYEAL